MSSAIPPGTYNLEVGTPPFAVLYISPILGPQPPYEVGPSSSDFVWSVSENGEGQYTLIPQRIEAGVIINYYIQPINPNNASILVQNGNPPQNQPTWLLQEVKRTGDNTYTSNIEYTGTDIEGKYWTESETGNIVLSNLVSVTESTQVFTWTPVN